MKKPSNEQRLSMMIISREREERRKVSNYKKTLKNRLKSGGNYREIDKLKYLTMAGPDILGCSSQDSMDCLVPWLSKLRETTIKKNTPVLIDFRNSTKAESVGFIIIFAEIDRIQSIKGKNFIRGNSPKENVAAQVFHHIGLSRLLGIRDSIPVTDQSVTYWQHTHGTQIDSDRAGKLIVKIAKDHNLADNVTEALFNGVSEAITNSVMHAYPVDGKTIRYYGDKKWWMFTGINNDKLHVVVCDLGIGIPNSLEHKHPDLFQKFKSFFKSGNHSMLIEIAMREGRSRSEQPHRGLGMVELKNFIDFTHNGHLGIFSQKGLYTYRGDGRNNIESSRNLKNSIMGTVVAWSVPLDVLSSVMGKSDEKKDN